MMTTSTPRHTSSSPRAVPPVCRPFRTPVRGHAFAPRAPGSTPPAPGQLARLVREPGNPADQLAVGVWVADADGRWRIGYLDRSVAARIAPRLDAGARIAARIDGWTGEPDGRWTRPLLVLLPDPEAAAHDDEPIEAPERRSPQRRDARTTGRLWGRPPGVARRTLR